VRVVTSKLREYRILGIEGDCTCPYEELLSEGQLPYLPNAGAQTRTACPTSHGLKGHRSLDKRMLRLETVFRPVVKQPPTEAGDSSGTLLEVRRAGLAKAFGSPVGVATGIQATFGCQSCGGAGCSAVWRPFKVDVIPAHPHHGDLRGSASLA
jgi:hypothetical protein